jgi:hypothetical protein
MVTKDPHQRITLENIKQHPWVNDGMCHSNVVNFNDMEALRTRFDPLNGAIDPEILESVRSLGLDVSRLPDDLLNGAMSDAASAYRQYVRMEMSHRLVDVVPGLLLRRPRSCWLHNDEIPTYESLPRFAPNNGLMSVPPRSVASVGWELPLMAVRHTELRRSPVHHPAPIIVGLVPHRRIYSPAMPLALDNEPADR